MRGEPGQRDRGVTSGLGLLKKRNLGFHFMIYRSERARAELRVGRGCPALPRPVLVITRSSLLKFTLFLVSGGKWLRHHAWAVQTRAQKGFATQGAAGVAKEGSLRQLVPVDTFLSLSSILSLVL